MYDDIWLSLTIFFVWLAIVITTNRRDAKEIKHKVE